MTLTLWSVATATTECNYMIVGDMMGAASTRNAPTLDSVHVGSVVTVRRSQRYYWTSRWQRDEAEALRDLDAGAFREFASPEEAAQWLAAQRQG